MFIRDVMTITGTERNLLEESAAVRVVIITQDDPFFLGKYFEYLCSNLPSGIELVACVIAKASPFGKNDSFLSKALRTVRIFGVRFFVHYALRYAVAKINKRQSVESVLAEYGVEKLDIRTSLNDSAALEMIASKRPDLLVSIAGSEIFGKALRDLAPLGCLNLHSSLLPKYRGLMPSFWVLKNNEKSTGVSVFFVDKGIDSGPILIQKKFEIGNMSHSELIRASKQTGMEAIIEALEKIKTQNYDLMENDNGQKTYFGFPDAQDVREFRRSSRRFY